MTSIRAVAFDLDGLMFNTEELYQHVGGEMLRRRGHEFTPELLDKMMGRPGRVALQIMIDEHGLSDTVEQLQEETDEIFAEILDERLAPMPGLLELLETLEAAGICKSVATSSRRPFTEKVLSKFDLLPRFDFLMTSDDIVHGKPHPEIYVISAGRHGVLPPEMMVLEDSENGCRAAVRSGAFVVAVPGGHSRRHDFSGARFVAESLHDRRIYDVLAPRG